MNFSYFNSEANCNFFDHVYIASTIFMDPAGIIPSKYGTDQESDPYSTEHHH